MRKLFRDPFFNAFDELFLTSDLAYSPQVKINKKNDEYFIFMSVPGLTKEDLKISLKERELEISYKENDENIKFVSSFSKKYILPEAVNKDGINGSVENGILELRIPLIKKEPIERYISLN